jgi:hypothetical protein
METASRTQDDRNQLAKPAQNSFGPSDDGDFGQSEFLPSDRCSRPLILARRMRFSAASDSLRRSNS